MRKNERLKYLRVLYGLNQTQIGKSIGASRNYISQIENEKLAISEEQYKKVLNSIYRIGEANKQGRINEVLEDIKNELKRKIEYEREVDFSD